MIQKETKPTRPIILVIAGAYLPGYRAGGPIRSIANIVDALSDDFDFLVITTDHDLGERGPYPGVVQDAWVEVGKAKVMYLSRRGQALHRLWKLIRNTPYDVIYLNSFFARRFSMFPYALWRLGLIKRTPLVLAPRGEFSIGALGLNRRQKIMFLGLCKFANWYGSNQLLWHASSELEAIDIRMVFEASPDAICPSVSAFPFIKKLKSIKMNISIAMNIGSISIQTQKNKLKEAGSISLAFISRISPKKNLDFALKTLLGIHGRVNFNICGPIEDINYWNCCNELIAMLPSTIVVNYQGEILHEDVSKFFSENHIFLFPTRGENYGHVISEALLSGCPVIISDQTPWRNLQSEGVGWDLPLGDMSAFQKAIQQCVDMKNEEYAIYSSRAKRYGLESGSNLEVVKSNLKLFNSALEIIKME